jgi:hypothetical protein
MPKMQGNVGREDVLGQSRKSALRRHRTQSKEQAMSYSLPYKWRRFIVLNVRLFKDKTCLTVASDGEGVRVCE